MKSIFQSTISYLDTRFSVRQARVSEKAGLEIYAGYCHLSEALQGDVQPVNRGCRQVAILYADIVDYTRLTSGDRLVTRRRMDEGRKIFKACIAVSEGKLAHFTGDAILAEFDDAESALRCAVNVQLAVRNWNSCLDSAEQVRYRIGVSAGEAVVDQSDRAIGLSARLEGLARTSGICVSKSVRESIRQNSEIRFVSLGKRYLKDVCEPVEAFWIEVDGAELGDCNLPSFARISAVAS